MSTALPLYLSVIVGNICCRYRKFAKKEHYLFGRLPNKYYFCSMNK